MITTLLFDLDGTLVNTIDDLANAVDYTLNQYNISSNYTVDDYKMMVGNGVSKLVERAFNGRIDDNEIVNALTVFKKRYNETLLCCSKPYDGIVEMIHSLSELGFNIAVVTNKPQDSAQIIINKFFNDNEIHLVVGQRDKIPCKPNPDQVNIAKEFFNVDSENCIFIGDSKTDIETAINSNMKSIGVLWGFRQKNELLCAKADYILQTVKELNIFLKNFKKSVDK